ncbi:hypothetical protein BU24DRAFT_339173, partial [Aaosphaeria arxii CBS 175.79]
LPVRSAILKQCTGGLVVEWVTISESPLLYVFLFFCQFLSCPSNGSWDGIALVYVHFPFPKERS